MTSKSTIYDFVIVGSGIGGLISSVLLAMEGHSVLVLEKNHQIGGSLQVFSRDKCVFDTGVHYVGSLDKGENLYQIFKYVGILDDLKMQRLDQEQFDVYRFEDGKTYRFGLGYEQFKKGLLEDFPNEEKAIDLFCQKVIEVCNSFPLYNLEEDSPSTGKTMNGWSCYLETDLYQMDHKWSSKRTVDYMKKSCQKLWKR